MRCIEICELHHRYTCRHQINRNMRCIEMYSVLLYVGLLITINRNMRCIEIEAYCSEQSIVY